MKDIFNLYFIKQGFYTYLLIYETAKFSDILLIVATNLQKDGFYQDTGHPFLKCIVLIFSALVVYLLAMLFFLLPRDGKERMYLSIARRVLVLAHTDISIFWYPLVFPFFPFFWHLRYFFLFPMNTSTFVLSRNIRCCFKYDIWFQIFSFLFFSNYPTSASRGFSLDFFRHL